MKKLTTLALITMFLASGARAQQIKSVVLEKGQKHSELSFIVASESNVVDYRIEGSSDNKRFEIVGKVRSTGNSVLTKTYRYELLGDHVYYRVASVGMNGAINYSETVAKPTDVDYPTSRAVTEKEQMVVSGR